MSSRCEMRRPENVALRTVIHVIALAIEIAWLLLLKDKEPTRSLLLVAVQWHS